MASRYLTIWFRHLRTDWHTRRHPDWKESPLVLRQLQQGRMVITATNAVAEREGMHPGMVLADARAVHPELRDLEDDPAMFEKLLHRFAIWFIRYSPVVAIDHPDGLILDIRGVPHLWGGEEAYLSAITQRMAQEGYAVRTAIAGTIGAAWALTHYGPSGTIVAPGREAEAIRDLPVEALRIESEATDRLRKLGLRHIQDILHMPKAVLRRRFGEAFLLRLFQSLGRLNEHIKPVQEPAPYEERLQCLEHILTRTGIDIALERLLSTICTRLSKEGKGLRRACFKAFRIDGKLEQVEIGTHRPSHHAPHLFNLFALKLDGMAPGPGIELFVLEAHQVEDQQTEQERIWQTHGGLEQDAVAEWLDKLSNKIGSQAIHRYLPAEHYWPERSVQEAGALSEQPASPWPALPPRPLRLLPQPERITVAAPVPDYPPMLFRHRGKVHKIMKADGPERIEQEWWLQEGRHRDYYQVEDEAGQRYWLYRDGHYDEQGPAQWFLHGYYA